ncbi:hypothetical protein [Pseudomonas sp. 25571]|uniref:hypothetical protein n=1 Tax=Pseudomonas sp. 25571 TaxID=2967216 RepID=UPI0023633E1D|nr:hypothetical protein [Pseudomonas sp. 25571]MDD2064514.1 hypothetical protein [Pseudomonas sp. 25571]
MISQLLDLKAREMLPRINHYLSVHSGQEHIDFVEHLRSRRREKSIQAQRYTLIYLDTNAWKCAADYRQGKVLPHPEMTIYAEALERAAGTGEFAFPIGAPTYFELDSMTDPSSRDSLSRLVDELSKGFCTLPHSDAIGSEISQIRLGQLDEVSVNRDMLCSPVELMGIPSITFNDLMPPGIDQTTFCKAQYDVLTELPFSVQLEVARIASGEKWNNRRGIDELNARKVALQAKIPDLIAGQFIELQDGMESWYAENGIDASPLQIMSEAVQALKYWKDNPGTKALPTLRIISSLHGLMMFDAQRKYKKGDLCDFLVAATALPATSAFFTDRKLANTLADPRIKLDTIFDCDVVSGYGEMAKYLSAKMPG